ncbi:hypothetical protein J2S55_006910 [Streptosporangium brasiliense]|uniref:Uncharacterized protein n=1 Tax=Streptosporangium brasiliense TaxID=47480 RepID=A0ABT9REE3_9ACTN|nr:hypothetical protein [Streptosporangium brasiliense]
MIMSPVRHEKVFEDAIESAVPTAAFLNGW